MKNHFDISGGIEIREVDIAGMACTFFFRLHRRFCLFLLLCDMFRLNVNIALRRPNDVS